jgi:hypothetical protein
MIYNANLFVSEKKAVGENREQQPDYKSDLTFSDSDTVRPTTHT